jgi:hypothetical protein
MKIIMSGNMSAFVSVCMMGFRGWRGYILGPETKHDLPESSRIANHGTKPNRVKKIAPNFYTLFAAYIMAVRLFKGLAA